MRIAKTITLFFILLLIPVSLFAQSKDDLKKAVSYYNKGNYSEAAKLFDLYLEKKPDPGSLYLGEKPDPEVHYLQGYAFYKMSKFNEARDSFRYAYPLDSIPLIAQDKAIVRIDPIPLIAQAKDDSIKAKDDLVKNKDDLIKAVSSYDKGNYSEAVKLFDLYLEKNPDPKVYFLKGYAFYKMGKFNEARDSFNQAYAIDPEVKVSKATDVLLPPEKSNESQVLDGSSITQQKK